jgi:hypothetical protein
MAIPPLNPTSFQVVQNGGVISDSQLQRAESTATLTPLAPLGS